ncbi:MAG: signal peptidase I [Ktedonobacteraceae bacterium]
MRLSRRGRVGFHIRSKRGFELKRSQLAREVVEILIITGLIFIVVRFVVQSYHIDGPSMQPGLTTNEYVMVNKVVYLFHAPERGDVIVFHYPHDTTQDYIKRVIGLPGDVVETDNTRLWVNGTLLKEPYISTPSNQQATKWKVPQDQYFVVGDNRPVSDDSRSWGFVPREYIVGKAAAVFWPLSQLHFISTYSDVYAGIKGGN